MEPVLGGRDDGSSPAARPCRSAPQWSPSLADGTTGWELCGMHVAGQAAMEPVLGGRDDGPLPPRPSRAPTSPQWSPSLADGTTDTRYGGSFSCTTPQWSPSLADGTTTGRRHLAPRCPRAAMEPVLGGRDDPAWRDSASLIDVQPQWSPSLADGTTMKRAGQHVGVSVPQWSPSLADGTTSPVMPALARGSCRNGARPWRTGRPAGHRTVSCALTRPQWSPSLADGTTSVSDGDVPEMMSPQWSPSLADGTTSSSPGLRGTGRACRNGARPWRTGRLTVIICGPAMGVEPQWSPSLADGTTHLGEAAPVHQHRAAMEPVLGGRDDPPQFSTAPPACWPQWSPSLADGTTCTGRHST